METQSTNTPYRRENLIETGELNKGLGHVCKCEKDSGKTFLARFIKIQGPYFIFMNKLNEIIPNLRQSIIKMEVVQ